MELMASMEDMAMCDRVMEMEMKDWELERYIR